jgi:hypothetical protein
MMYVPVLRWRRLLAVTALLLILAEGCAIQIYGGFPGDHDPGDAVSGGTDSGIINASFTYCSGVLCLPWPVQWRGENHGYGWLKGESFTQDYFEHMVEVKDADTLPFSDSLAFSAFTRVTHENSGADESEIMDVSQVSGCINYVIPGTSLWWHRCQLYNSFYQNPR